MCPPDPTRFFFPKQSPLPLSSFTRENLTPSLSPTSLAHLRRRLPEPQPRRGGVACFEKKRKPGYGLYLAQRQQQRHNDDNEHHQQCKRCNDTRDGSQAPPHPLDSHTATPQTHTHTKTTTAANPTKPTQQPTGGDHDVDRGGEQLVGLVGQRRRLLRGAPGPRVCLSLVVVLLGGGGGWWWWFWVRTRGSCRFGAVGAGAVIYDKKTADVLLLYTHRFTQQAQNASPTSLSPEPSASVSDKGPSGGGAAALLRKLTSTSMRILQKCAVRICRDWCL